MKERNKRRVEKWLAAALALVFLLALLPGGALAAEIVASGECGLDGNNLTWTLDADGVLTITGSGEMYRDAWDVGELEEKTSKCPWEAYKNEFKRVILPEGLVNITAVAFQGCEKLVEATIPGSVRYIGERAFDHCAGLTKVVICDGVSFIVQSAFSNCPSLKSVYIPCSVTSIDKWVFYGSDALTDIYYGGSREDWDKIEISMVMDDFDFNAVTIHFNSEPPTLPAEPTEPAETTEPVQPAEPAEPIGMRPVAGIASRNVHLVVDGKPVQWSESAIYIDGNDRTMANCFDLCAALGLTAEWNTEKGEITISGGGKSVCYTVGSISAKTGSEMQAMDTTAAVFDDQPYVPVRYVAEFFGRTVGWDDASRTVTID